MKRNRDACDGRLSREVARAAVVLVLMLMPIGLVRAQWLPFSPPDSAPDRTCHATAYDPVNDGIYMIGGTPYGYAGSSVSLCQRYDPVADTWTTMAPMPTPRSWITATYVRGKVYIVGGMTNTSEASGANEEHTIAANSWTTRRPLPESVMCHMTGVWRDSLVYVCGGMDNVYNATRAVQVYNPLTDSWAYGTPLPMEGDMGSAVIVGDTIYIPDAYNRPQGRLWGHMLKGAIDPDTATQITWLWGLQPPKPVYLAGVVSLHNKVYAFSYHTDTLPDTTTTMTGYVYDPGSGTYTGSLPSLLLEEVMGLRGQFVVAREAADEIYQVAGSSWPSGVGSGRYNKLFVTPDGTREAGPAVGTTSMLRVSTLFRNGAQIRYEVDRPCWATLTVYDQSGRVVRTLVSGQRQAGSYTAAWDGRDHYGRPTGSGVYFCRLQAGEFTAAKKMVKVE
jgi:hypothetical protein